MKKYYRLISLIMIGLCSLTVHGQSSHNHGNTVYSGDKGFRYLFNNDGGENYCGGYVDVFPNSGTSITSLGASGIVKVSHDGSSDMLANRFESNGCVGTQNLNFSTLTERKIRARIKVSKSVRVGVLAASNIGGQFTYADGGTEIFKQVPAGSFREVIFTIPDKTWNNKNTNWNDIVGWGVGVRSYTDENVRTGSVQIEIDWIQFGSAVPVNKAPIVEKDIPDYNLYQYFADFTIDLKQHFDDDFTHDLHMNYTVANNPNIDISIDGFGIATVGISNDFTGTNADVEFTAMDAGGLSVTQKVTFVVSEKNTISSSIYDNYVTDYNYGYVYTFSEFSTRNYCNGYMDVFPKNGINLTHGGASNTIKVTFDGSQGSADLLSNRFEDDACSNFYSLNFAPHTKRTIKARVKVSQDVRLGILAASDIGGNFVYADGGNDNFKQVNAGSFVEIEYTIPDETWNNKSTDWSKIIGWGIGVRDYNNEGSKPSGSVTIDIKWVKFGDGVDVLLSTNEEQNAENTYIFPNPASEELNISNFKGKWKIMNSLGINVLSGSREKININQLTKGIYFIMINGKQHKFIKR